MTVEPGIPCAVLGCRRARRPTSETGVVFGTCAQHLRFDLSAPASGALAFPPSGPRSEERHAVPATAEPPPSA